MPTSDLLTPAQFHETLLARGVRVDLVTIRRWCKAGKLGTKVAGRWYIRPEEINKVYAPEEPPRAQPETLTAFQGVREGVDGQSEYLFTLAAGNNPRSVQEVSFRTDVEFIMCLAVTDRLLVRSDLLPQMCDLLKMIRFDILRELYVRFNQTTIPEVSSQRVGTVLRWFRDSLPNIILTGTFMAMKLTASIPNATEDLDVDLSAIRESLLQGLKSLQSMSPDEVRVLLENAAGSQDKSRE